jgi:hypothetical protein
MRTITKAMFFVLFISVALTQAQTSDIASQIDRAKSFLSQGKYTEAVSELNAAISQIQSLRMGGRRI